MKIGMEVSETTNAAVAGTALRRRAVSGESRTSRTAPGGNTFRRQLEEETVKKKEQTDGKNTISSIRSTPKVPYGYLAKDGVITYNGVQFTCDERTNSICLGDMTDRKQVINIPLSGGGHLKVNRANLGQLSKAIGMFSPEDVNLILRAIHLDAKVQSVQKEVEDLEDGVGEQIAADSAAETDEKTEEC